MPPRVLAVWAKTLRGQQSSIYHATGKSMEIFMYKSGENLLIICYFYHATGKSMEISKYEAGKT